MRALACLPINRHLFVDCKGLFDGWLDISSQNLDPSQPPKQNGLSALLPAIFLEFSEFLGLMRHLFMFSFGFILRQTGLLIPERYIKGPHSCQFPSGLTLLEHFTHQFYLSLLWPKQKADELHSAWPRRRPPMLEQQLLQLPLLLNQWDVCSLREFNDSIPKIPI